MKFSIRDVLLVMVIVVLAVGWCVDRFLLTFDSWYWKDWKNDDLPKSRKVQMLDSQAPTPNPPKP